MSFIRVPPDRKYIAEVVILLSSLRGSNRHEFNKGRIVKDLLEVKRAHFKVIDLNRDARVHGEGHAENLAIQKLTTENKLQSGDDGELLSPQIFIDGNYVGGDAELQGLEDDARLEPILVRRTCTICFARRPPECTKCPACSVSFEEIMPHSFTIDDHLHAIALAADEDDESDGDSESEDDDDA
eukprot:NODE_18337_length_897_cov_10.984416.p1 GENE.NODE_18337_length_897_cov_10.984416~~NODE_18337_length_897_cov_10.984416.p1  ORF type:complete len:184 (-),score=25.65 NODE_18337_length_897_cov_10.984416:213-764(-)